MAEFVAFNKNVEVNGRTILSVLDGMKGFEASAKLVLSKNGIENPQPNQWYPQQAWLNAFKEISKTIGEQTLISIGQKVPENAEWPPDVNSLETAFQSIDIAYHMNHRINGTPLFNPETGVMLEGIGHYHYQKTGEKEITMICENPYPCAFDKGVIKSVANRFKPAGFKVSFKEGVAMGCRTDGAHKCTYVIYW